MGQCGLDIYVLPTITFVGGETQTIDFHLYTKDGRRPLDMRNSSCQLAIAQYGTTFGNPEVEKDVSILVDSTTGVFNIISVNLDIQDTLNLSGKYVYQLTIKDAAGHTEIPRRGIMNIINNINREFLQ